MSGIARRVVIALVVALGVGLLGFLGASSARAETSTATESTTSAQSAAPKAADTSKTDSDAPAPKPKPKPDPKPEPKPDPKPEPKPDPKPSTDDTASSGSTGSATTPDAAPNAVADPPTNPDAPAVGSGAPSLDQAALLPPVVHDHATTVVTGDETNALALSVDDHPKAVTPGGSITYDIVITNVGTDPATGIVWADIIPKELTDFWVEFVGGSNTVEADWTCATAGDPQPAVMCKLDPAAALDSGDYAHFRVHATVDPDTPVGTVIQNAVLADWNENPGDFRLPIVAVVNTPVVAKAVNASFVWRVNERGLPLTGAAGLAWLLFAGLALAGTGGIALGATRRRRIAD
ncbi:MAG: LPXTG cell wall anchor domain-containing protein [Acidimicrobiia bacterium]